MGVQDWTTTATQARDVSNVIKAQLGLGGLMRCGARDLRFTREEMGGLTFTGTFAKPGTTRPRRCDVRILLTGDDLYTVRIKTIGTLKTEPEMLHEVHGLYADQMVEMLVSLG